ncbi:IS3 family insertion sequence transposase domain-containing protein (plasmid) [Rhizobium gallicum]|uniref:IS3 family insertion sequence transposase domain-containing protein n=1 Tax=Rhizobium gallicum TaxID=56730 RepID=A0A1L5NQD2_9HYPH|nr:IS3 family insertion sequence transposase domain-containing protein [Rhizobium gallicum]
MAVTAMTFGLPAAHQVADRRLMTFVRNPDRGQDGRMKKQRVTEEQVIAVLKEQEAGAKAADLCRKHGISEATFYNWKAKYGGMEVSEAKRVEGA